GLGPAGRRDAGKPAPDSGDRPEAGGTEAGPVERRAGGRGEVGPRREDVYLPASAEGRRGDRPADHPWDQPDEGATNGGHLSGGARLPEAGEGGRPEIQRLELRGLVLCRVRDGRRAIPGNALSWWAGPAERPRWLGRPGDLRAPQMNTPG